MYANAGQRRSTLLGPHCHDGRRALLPPPLDRQRHLHLPRQERLQRHDRPTLEYIHLQRRPTMAIQPQERRVQLQIQHRQRRLLPTCRALGSIHGKQHVQRLGREDI